MTKKLLRPTPIPDPGEPAPRSLVPVVLALAAALVAGGLVLATQLIGRDADRGGSVPSFLSTALGAQDADAPLVRRTMPGATVEVSSRSHGMRTERGSLSIGAGHDGTATWTRFGNGATRRTSFGRETITIGRDRVEQFLTVAERQGARTWRWPLTTTLEPRLRVEGSVGFVDPRTRRVSDLLVPPVELFDDAGRKITPEGLRWSVATRGGKDWLELRLDDAGMPLPYTIDPAIVYQTSSAGVQNGAGSASIAPTVPASIVDGDFLLAHVAVRGSGTAIGAPGGWTLIRLSTMASGTTMRLATYSKRASATDAGTVYSWSLTPNAIATAGISAWAGVDTTAAVNSAESAPASNSRIITLPAVTAATLRIGVGAIAGNNTFPATCAAGAGCPRRMSANNASGMASGVYDGYAATGSSITTTGGLSTRRIGQSISVTVDSTNPTTAPVTITEGGAGSHQSGTTFYYRPAGAGGTFTVTEAPTDPQSGIQDVIFPGLAGGFTPVGPLTDTTSPYSRTYTWPATTGTESGSKTLTVTDNSANTATTSFTITADSTAPATGSVTPTGLVGTGSLYSTSTTLSLTLAPGTDAGSGVAASGNILRRAEATLSSSDGWANGTCGAFGLFGTIATDPGSPYTDNAAGGIVTGKCYRYEYVVLDNVGNARTYTSVDVKVDTVAPIAPTLTLAEVTGTAYQHISGTELFYNPSGSNAGSFTVDSTDGTTMDGQSGIAQVDFPALPAGFTGGGLDTTPTPFRGAYSWDNTAVTSPASRTVTVTNNATGPGTQNFTVTKDTSAPTGHSVALAGGPWYTSASVSLTPTDGTDNVGGAGIDTASRVYEKEEATLAGGVCGSWGGTWTVVSNPDATVQSGKCYRYRLTISDNVANASAPSGVSAAAQVDTSGPGVPGLSYGGFTNASVTGSTVYVRSSAAGAFTVSGTSTDTESGIGSLTFPTFGAGWGGGGPDGSSPYQGVYAFAAGATIPSGNQDVTATNGAGTVSAASPFTVVADGTAPSSSAQCDGGSCAPWFTTSPVSVVLSASDGGSGLAEIRYTLDGSDPSPVSPLYSTPLSIASTTTVKFRGYDNVGNEESVSSVLVQVDTSQPSAPSLSLSETDPDSHVSGTTLYYNPSGANAGSFSVDGSSADGQSGIDRLSFPTLAGATGGGDDLSSPYSSTYDWTSSTTATGAQTVTARNGAGLNQTGDFTVTQDTAAPTGHSVAVSGGAGWVTGSSVTLLPTDGTDGGAGLDTASRVYEREDAPLTAGSCGAWSGSWTTVSSPDNTIASGLCYRYRLKLSDNVGNQSAPSAPTGAVKVDTSAPPAPTLSFGSFTNASATGSTVYIRPGVAGGLAVGGAVADAQSGIASVAFPGLGANWTGGGADAGAPYEGVYTFAAAASAPSGNQDVIALNGAGTASAASPFTVVEDSAAPVTSAECNAGSCAPWFTSTPVSVTLPGADGGSGIAEIRYTLDGSDPDGTSTLYSGAISIGSTTTVKYRGYDKVGNVEAVRTRVVQVDTTAPSVPTLSFAGFTNASATGTTVYVRPGVAGGFTVAGPSADGESGIASVGFPALGANWTGGGADAGAPYEGVYTYTAAASAPSGNQDVVATNGGGTASAAAPFTVVADSTAPVSSAQCDGGSCAPWFTTSPVSVVLSGSDGGSGLAEIRYTLDGSDPSPVSPLYSTPLSIAATTTVKYRAYDNVGNEEPVASTLVKVDTSQPAVPALTLVETDAESHVSGTTLYYNPSGSNAGSFTASATSSDAESGIAKVAFPGLAGMTGGGDDTSSPYEGVYDWTSSSTASGTETATAHNGAGLTRGGDFTLTQDTTAPAGQSVALSGGAGWVTGGSVALVPTDGTDGGAGIDTSSRVYERESAPLTAGACGAWSGSWTTVTNPDNTIASGFCYRYRLKISDNVANQSAPSAATGAIKVDTSAPADPTLSFGSFTNASATGSTVYIRPGTAGGLTVTATSTDAESAVASHAFPALGANWTGGGADSSAPFEGVYAFTAAAAAPSGNQDVTATNGAGTASGASAFTVVEDSAAPVTSAECNAGSCAPWFTSTPVSVTLAGADGGSGIAEIRYTLDGSDPDGASTLYSGAISIGSTTTVKYRAYDRVGNVEAVRTRIVQVDTTAPTAPTLSFDGFTNASATGTAVYVRPGVAGGFTVHGPSADGESGIASVTFPALGANWTGGGADSGAPYESAYTFSAAASAPSGNQDVVATNGAGSASAASPFTVVADSTAPTSSAQCDGGSCAPWFTTSPVSVALSANDGGSGLAAIRYTLDGSDPSPVSPLYSTPLSIAATTTVKYRAYDNVGNEESVATTLVKIDTTIPSAPSLSFGSFTNASATGSTLFVRSGAAGGFTVTGTSDDPESSVASMTFPGFGADWSGGGTDGSSPYEGIYSFGAAATPPSGNQNVTAANGSGSSSDPTPFTVVADTTAPTSSVECEGGSCAPWFTTSPVAVALSATDGGSGLAEIRYTLDGSDPSPLSPLYSTPLSIAATATVKFRAYDRVGNEEPVASVLVKIDTTQPAAPSLTLDETDVESHVAGTTLYYNPGGSNSGSFTVTATSSDAESGIDRIAFPAVAGAAGGGDDTSSPYTATYDWNETTTANGAQTVTARNAAGLEDTADFTLTPDTAAPNGQSLTVSGGAGWITGGPVTLVPDDGTDSGSGINTSSRVYVRDQAPLADGACGTWEDVWDTVSNPDNTVASGFCYRYAFWVTDYVGNDSGASDPTGVVKVDTSAPAAPTLSYGSFTATAQSGGTVWYRPSAAGGSFVVTAAGVDAQSGIASYAFPAPASGWFVSGSGDSRTYAHAGSPTDPADPNDVTATNNAGLTSPAAGFTVSPDGSAPTGMSATVTGGSVTYVNGYDADGTVTVTTDNGNDGESGLAAGTAVLERQTASLASDACGSFGAWSTATSPDTVASGLCARYRLRVSDRVGNEATFTSANVVKVDTSAPAAPALGFSGFSNASASGSTVWFRPGVAGGFTLTPTATDAESGIASTSHPNLGAGWSRTGDDYTFTAAAVDPVEPNNVTATNGAGLTSPAASFTVSPDSAAPTGGSVSYANGYDADGTVTVTTDNGNDGESGLAAGTAVLERQTASLASDACGSFGAWSTATSPDTVASGLCARYRLRVSDRVGNEATFTSANVVKVDTSAPAAPALTPTEGSAWSHVSGTTVYLNAQGANAGLFTVGAASTDAESGIAKINFPALAGAAGGGDDTSSPFSATYGWDASTTASGAQTVIAHNVAGLTSSAQFDVVLDTAGPTGGSVTYTDGYDADGTVTVTTDNGSDGAAGLAAGTAVLERQTASLAGGVCGSFGGWSTVTSPDTVASGLCARYRLRVSDRVGNEATFTSANVVRVDTDPATVSLDDPGANLRGSVALTATASDGGSGVSSVEFQRSPAGLGSWTTVGTDATAPYSDSFDTSAVADGLVDLRAIATDAAGNPTTSAIVSNRRVDNTAPAATMDDPGANVRATVTLTATASDGGSGVASLAFEYRSSGGGSWTATPAAWDTTALSDGLYDVRVTATDAAGNATTAAPVTNRRVDNTAPAVTMDDPGADVSGTVSLSANSSDGGSGVASVTFQYKLAADSTWTATPAAWNTTVLGDGLYDLRANATDNAGNAATSAPVTNRRVDNHAPDVTITAPGTHVNGAAADPFSVTATSPDSDLSQVEFFRCDNPSASCSTGSWTSLGVDTSAPFSGSWPVDADGNRALRAVARDVAGNTGSNLANTLVDRTAPSGGSVTYADGWDADGTVTITGANGTDGGSGVDAATATIERQTATLANGVCGAYGPWNAVTSPDTVASGDCARYRLRVADFAGNVATYGSANAVKVDTTAPAAPPLTLSETEPDEHAAGTTLYYNGQGGYSGTFTVEAAAADAQSGIASVSFPLVFGDSAVDSVAPYALAYDWTGADTTEGSFTVTATNGAGLTSGADLTLVRDVAPPSGGSVAYVDGYRTSASVALTLVDGNDATSGVDAASGLLRRASAPLAGGVCGSFGGFATIASDPAAGYTDLTVASGNCYRYEYAVTDNVGNEVAYASAAVAKVDAEAPTGAVDDPGSNLRGTVSLTATAADTGGAGVDSVEFRHSPAGGGPWTTIATDTSAPYSAAFDTTAIADGLYDLQVIVTDGAGSATASAPVTARRIDNTPPAVSLTDPGAHVRATVNLSATASDAGSGLGGTVFEVAPAGTGAWSATPAAWDTTAVADGFYDVRAVATDLAGNQAFSTVLGREVDNTAPATTIDSQPASLDNDTTPEFAFSSNESPDATFECRVGGGAWSACSSPHTLAPIGDGAHTFDVRARDLAGNVDASPASWTWTVDVTDPSVSLTYPSTGALLTGVVTLTASATDASGAPTVIFEASGAGLGAWTTVSSSWDTATVADGRYDVRATATDAAGNTASATATDVLVDNTAPTVTVTSPAGDYVNATAASPFGLAATATDDGAGVATVEFLQRLDTTFPCASPSSSWSSIGLDPTDPFGADWTLPADGEYVLCALARDAAGHTRTANATVTVDRTDPVPAIDAVAPFVRGTIALASPSTDATSGVGQVDFQQTASGGSSWQLVGADTSAPFGASFDTTAVPDGDYDLRAFVTDRAGNAAASTPVTTRVDNTPPTGNVTGPAAGSNLRLTVPVTADSADGGSGVESAQLQTSPAGTDTWTNLGAADTGAPYGVDWDTTTYADGLYDLRVITTDRAGNTFTSAALASVRVDNTKPAANLADPGAYLRGSISLAGTATDEGSGVATVEFQHSPAGQDTWTSISTDTDEPYSAGLDTGLLADGLYDLRVLVTDRAGNQETRQIANRRVDNTKPAASLADPGAALNSGVTLSAAASDAGSGVASVEFQRAAAGSGSWATLATDTSDPYTAAFDTTAVSDGFYDLRVVVTDNAGNQETAGVGGRRVDNTAPTTSASGVPSGPTPGPITITLAASDAGVGVAETKYRIDGGALQSYSGGITIGGADGAYTIQYFSVDALGNVEATHTVEVVIDNTGPGAGPGDPGRYLRGVVTLTAAPTDDSGIASVEFQFSPAGAGAWASIATVIGAGPYETTWNTVAVTDGPYDLQVVVTDMAGNVTTESLPDLPKIVDNTSPTGSVTSPAEGALRSGTFTITATAADDPADGTVAAVEFQVRPGGGSWTTVATDTAAPYAATWNSAGSPDGAAELRVVVSDAAGNDPTTSAVRTITLDNNAPTVNLSAPSAGGGTIALSASGSGDIDRVTFERRSGGGAWSAISTDSTPGDGFTASFATTSLADGTYELRARATDISGNEGTSGAHTISIDNTDPTATISAPTAGAEVGGPSVALTANASDGTSGVASVTFQVRPAGGGGWADVAVASGAPWSASWNATSVSDGQYELRARVGDLAGNTGYTTPIGITVDSTAPTVTLGPVAGTLSGTVALTATTTGSGATSVTFERRTSGGSWAAIGSDSSEPWSLSFNTSSVGDGVYDLRAVVRDEVGNSSESVRTDVRIDNSAPTLVSSKPQDGETVDAVDKVELTASEPLAGVDATIDGKAVTVTLNAAAATIAGTLGPGPHVVSGELRDSAGKSSEFRVSFTVAAEEGEAGEEGEVERNFEPGVGGSFVSVDGGLTVIFPAGAVAGAEGWTIFKVNTGAPRGAVGGGFAANGPVWDITARTPSGKTFHSFAKPLELVFADGSDGVVPATFDGGSWRPLPRLVTPGTLPADQSDGFWRDGETFHVLTRHLTLWAILSDNEAPQPPQDLAGTVGADGLTLHWRPGADNSGLIDEVTLYVNGERYASYGTDVTEAKFGPFAADDPRTFTWRERDAAGNVSAETPRLRTLPPLASKTLAQAQAALGGRGFRVGTVTERVSSAPPGTVIEPAGIALAVEGSAVPLVVAAGAAAGQAKLVFSVVGPKQLDRTKRSYVGVRIKTTRRVTARATLVRSGGGRLYTWRFNVRAGASIVKLRLPRTVTRPGRYRIAFAASAAGQTARRTVAVDFIRPGPAPTTRGRVGVVLTGLPASRAGIVKPLASGKTRATKADVDAAFDTTANRAQNVGVVVVDVDRFGLQLVRDLRTVFPMVRIVALSNKPKLLVRAIKAGATIALPRSTPDAQLVSIVRRLATRR